MLDINLVDPQAGAVEAEEIQGELIPKLGFGTWRLRGRECYDSVLSALELGYRHIDTAEEYRNQREVGQAIHDSGVPRDELFLTTKVWHTNLRPDDVRRSCEQSLQELQLDAVDLLLIHWPNRELPLDETLAAFNELRAESRTRHIGVSNFHRELLQEAQSISEAPIFCDQVEYHLYQDQRELVRYCQDQDLMLTAYSPLAKGKLLRDQTLQRIADQHGKLPEQVALRWLIQQEKVFPIPKAAKLEHRKSNLDSFDFHLEEEEIKILFQLAA